MTHSSHPRNVICTFLRFDTDIFVSYSLFVRVRV